MFTFLILKFLMISINHYQGVLKLFFINNVRNYCLLTNDNWTMDNLKCERFLCFKLVCVNEKTEKKNEL